MTFARNANYVVQFEPYSLEPGEVGAPIFRPVIVSRHRSPLAAARAIVRLLTGTDQQAVDYLRAHKRNDARGIALRYVARETVAPFKALSVNDLRAL